jgi:soluble lytic murein transglycosylase-like protein
MSRLSHCALAVLAIATFAAPSARAGAAARDAGACAAHAPEAARRSGLPLGTVFGVMAAESAGNPRAVSPKGAMGCMQIMPATWTYLTNRYALGPDPFDARMNMIGGALYLAELAARYGFPGAYSAYNAGPGRYQRYVAGRAALPAETIAYAARIAGGTAPRVATAPPPRWQEASLFLIRPTAPAKRSAAPDSKASDVGSLFGGLFPLAADDDPTARD